MRAGRTRLSVSAAIVSFAGAACAPANSSPSEGGLEEPASLAQPIIYGTDSDAARDSVVLVMHYDAIQVGGGAAGCTGTLLTPRLVLTARHCVAVTDESAACDAAGKPTFGGVVHGNNMASKLYAFIGNQRPDFLAGLDKGARGAEIIDDASKTLCNHDIALILLERALPGAKTAPVRLDDGPRKDESVRVVGWGVTDKSSAPPTRQERSGVKVLSVGPADRLGPAEFRIGESGCAGDSGGPAFAESSGAVLGVLSRGGNDKGGMAGAPEACIGAENVFTSTAKYKDLILSAYTKAGQAPWVEGQPDPTTLPPPAPPSEEEEEGSRCTLTGGGAQGRNGGGVALVLAVALIGACARKRGPRS